MVTIKKAIKRIWCTHCDEDMEDKGVALDSPEDGRYYECPICKFRIVVFGDKKKRSRACIFSSICSLFYPESFTCMHGGGEYCGKYRSLSREVN